MILRRPGTLLLLQQLFECLFALRRARQRDRQAIELESGRRGA